MCIITKLNNSETGGRNNVRTKRTGDHSDSNDGSKSSESTSDITAVFG